MGWYVVESYQYAIEHGGRDSEGAIGEPKVHRQKISSRCAQREDGGWQPAPLSEEDLGRLRQVGVRGL